MICFGVHGMNTDETCTVQTCISIIQPCLCSVHTWYKQIYSQINHKKSAYVLEKFLNPTALHIDIDAAMLLMKLRNLKAVMYRKEHEGFVMMYEGDQYSMNEHLYLLQCYILNLISYFEYIFFIKYIL